MSQSNPTVIEATKYSENYILYGDQSRAWRVAFPNSKAKPKSVNERASRLHNLDKVQSRIVDLRDIAKNNIEDEFVITVEQKKKWLRQAVESGFEKKIDQHGNEVPISLPAAVSAVNEMNKMDGDHAVIRLAHGGDPDGVPLQSEVSDEDLAKKLADYGIER